MGTPAATGWDGGAQHLYQTLAQDAVYENPSKLVTFLDNHDHDRFLSVIGDDLDRYKMGLTWLLTTRGIPSMYYGTEILMKNFKDPTDAEVRKDFPGGWPGDKEDKFTAAGRTARENEAFDFVKKLATYRRDHPALHSGKLMQYLPEEWPLRVLPLRCHRHRDGGHQHHRQARQPAHRPLRRSAWPASRKPAMC